MKKQILLFLSLFVFGIGFSQNSVWTPINEGQLKGNEKVRRSSFPKEYKLFKLDLNSLKNQLVGVPLRGDVAPSSRSARIIELPNASGKIGHYRVVETPIMEAELAEKMPMIKSYAAQGIEDPTAVVRFSVTQFGLHSMSMSAENSTVFIDPFTQDRTSYIVYNKASLGKDPNEFVCLTNQEVNLPTLRNDRNSNPTQSLNTNDKKLRTYRLAQSCTAEYGNIFAGTGTDAQKKANIQAQMAITMTRVNGIYELDLSITMIFVANNANVIYHGSTTADPWGTDYNAQTGLTIDANIGFSNYDIGHNFNTSGGGNAGCLACVCSPDTTPTNTNDNMHKGTGMTGRANPTGDAFDIDYVAHEMGHQFGGYHTQSSSGCRSGSGFTEVEPGSGSTIMGYAGICDTNVQANSDAYFGYVNIRDISENVQNGVSSNIPNSQITNLTNNPPTASAGADYIIPISTAFVLEGSGTDPDGDAITYNWEENDPEAPNTTAAPTATRVAGPMFRSLNATTSNKRYMPNLTTVKAGNTSNTWEVCPSVTRDLNFSLTVRDNKAGGGQTASDLMKVSVSNTSGPFTLSAPNTAVSWAAGTNQTVTWNVNNTDTGAVNAKFVDLYLSTDGGNTYPILLASKVPNDGSETVTIPNNVGTQNRIMARGYGNIFFDISNVNFTTTAPATGFDVAFSGVAGEQNKGGCQGVSVYTYTFNYNTYGIFSSPTTFSATGVPANTTVTFSPTSRTTSGTVTMTVTTSLTTPAGLANIIVNGTSGATTKSVPFYLDMQAIPQAATLSTPANNAVAQDVTVNLTWAAGANTTAYDIQVATDSGFTNIIATGSSNTTNYSVSGLSQATDYYWRVLPKNSGCSTTYGAAFKFTTGIVNCSTPSSVDVPKTIASTGKPTITSNLNIPTGVVISDLNLNLNVSHTYVGELTITLQSPASTSVVVLNSSCAGSNNINTTFDNSGSALVCGADPAVSGSVIPLNSLSAFNGQNSTGTWVLTIADGGSGDGGALNSWSLNICNIQAALSNPDYEFANLRVFPNPNKGNFAIELNSESSKEIQVNVFDLRGRQIFNRSFANNGAFNQNINLENAQSGVYLVSISDGTKKTVKRVVVE